MNPPLPNRKSNTNPKSNIVLNLGNLDATAVFLWFPEMKSGEGVKAFLASGKGVERRFSPLAMLSLIEFWRFLLTSRVGLLSTTRVGPLSVASETDSKSAVGG